MCGWLAGVGRLAGVCDWLACAAGWLVLQQTEQDGDTPLAPALRLPGLPGLQVFDEYDEEVQEAEAAEEARVQVEDKDTQLRPFHQKNR